MFEGEKDISKKKRGIEEINWINSCFLLMYNSPWMINFARIYFIFIYGVSFREKEKNKFSNSRILL